MAMVSLESSHPAARPGPAVMPEVARALPIRRYPGERPPAGGGPQRSGTGVAILAQPSQSHECDRLGEVSKAVGDVRSAHTQGRPRHLMWLCRAAKVMHQSGAETLVTEEPYAFIAHVRVCGGAGWATAGSYPEADCLQPTLRCGFRQQLNAGVVATRGRGVYC